MIDQDWPEEEKTDQNKQPLRQAEISRRLESYYQLQQGYAFNKLMQGIETHNRERKDWFFSPEADNLGEEEEKKIRNKIQCTNELTTDLRTLLNNNIKILQEMLNNAAKKP